MPTPHSPGRPKKKPRLDPPRPSEYDECAAFMEWCDLHWRKYPGLHLLYHIPNGEWRDYQTGVKLKKMGVKRSIPDYHLPVSRHSYHSLYIEMKRIGEKPTRDQNARHEQLRAEGHWVEVAEGWEAAVATVQWYLG